MLLARYLYRSELPGEPNQHQNTSSLPAFLTVCSIKYRISWFLLQAWSWGFIKDLTMTSGKSKFWKTFVSRRSKGSLSWVIGKHTSHQAFGSSVHNLVIEAWLFKECNHGVGLIWRTVARVVEVESNDFGSVAFGSVNDVCQVDLLSLSFSENRV